MRLYFASCPRPDVVGGFVFAYLCHVGTVAYPGNNTAKPGLLMLIRPETQHAVPVAAADMPRHVNSVGHFFWHVLCQVKVIG